MSAGTVRAATLILSVSLLALSCGSATPATEESPGTYSNLKYAVAREGLQAQSIGDPFDVSIDNCEGARDATQTVERAQKYLAVFTIEVSNQVAAEFGGNIGVARAAISDQIGLELGVRLGAEQESRSRVEIVTPAGKKTITTLQWKEVWTKGTVAIKRPDGTFVDVLPFAALNSLTLDQLGSRALDCATGKTVEPQATAQITTPEIPVITPMPTATSIGTISVPGNSNQGTLFTASRTGRYVFKYVSGAYSTYPLNRTPPEGVLTWLADIRGFLNRPVEWNGRAISENTDFRIVSLGYSTTADEAQAKATKYSVPVSISLAQGDRLLLVAVDHKEAYNDNPGEVVLEVLFAPTQ